MPADTSSISLLAKRQRVKINSDYLCKHMEDAEYGPRRSISPLIWMGQCFRDFQTKERN